MNPDPSLISAENLKIIAICLTLAGSIIAFIVKWSKRGEKTDNLEKILNDGLEEVRSEVKAIDSKYAKEIDDIKKKMKEDKKDIEAAFTKELKHLQKEIDKIDGIKDDAREAKTRIEFVYEILKDMSSRIKEVHKRHP